MIRSRVASWPLFLGGRDTERPIRATGRSVRFTPRGLRVAPEIHPPADPTDPMSGGRRAALTGRPIPPMADADNGVDAFCITRISQFLKPSHRQAPPIQSRAAGASEGRFGRRGCRCVYIPLIATFPKSTHRIRPTTQSRAADGPPLTCGQKCCMADSAIGVFGAFYIPMT